MKPIGTHNYFVYIITNVVKTVLYIGVTNSLQRRLIEHKEKKYKNSFSARYNCFFFSLLRKISIYSRCFRQRKTIKRFEKR